MEMDTYNWVRIKVRVRVRVGVGGIYSRGIDLEGGVLVSGHTIGLELGLGLGSGVGVRGGYIYKKGVFTLKAAFLWVAMQCSFHSRHSDANATQHNTKRVSTQRNIT